jgi:hypothetical protein
VFDDFDGPAGRLPDPAVWAPWLSADKDYTSAHTDYPRNACLDGNGHLTLTAIRETAKDPRLGGRSVRYTTAMLTTQGRVERLYGTWSARIFIPPGKGHHPTFYLWGASYDPKTNPWPNCGEVDIIELQDTLQGSSIHGPGYDWLHGNQVSVAAPFDVRGGWHTYSCRHDPDRLMILIDGTIVAVFTPALLPAGKRWVFNQPLFAVLDLSVGTKQGNFDNRPDGQPFPVAMLVDWVRHEPLDGNPAMNKDQVAQIIVAEAKARHHTRDECLGELSALYQESQFDETIWDGTHTTYGVAQQDGSYTNRFQGAAAQVKAFFDKLDVKRTSPGHGDIWLNICWLQQAPNWPSAQYWWEHGRQAYLTEIKSRIATVTPYLDKYWPTNAGAQPMTDKRPDFNEYPMWSPNNSSRGTTKVDLFLLHTQEGPGNADSLAKYLQGNNVSYHYTISEDPNDHGVTLVDVVDTDAASWSVLSANSRSINLCFAGSKAAWSRADWLKQSRAIDVAAYVAVQDCRKYHIPLTVNPPPYVNIPGISDHRYVTQVLKDGTHTDVGDGFPWDVFAAAVSKYANGAAAPAPVPNPVPSPASPKPVGPADDQVTLRWNCLGGQTVVEALAEIRDKLLGTNDRTKTGAK